jgi:hypothetical protein
METVWNDLNGAERLNDWNDWNWLLSKIDRAIYTVFYRLINRLRRSDPEPALIFSESHSGQRSIPVGSETRLQGF